MRRWLPMAGAVIVAAMVINVAVAWLVLLPLKWAPMLTTSGATRGDWPTTTPPGWPKPAKVMTKNALGFEARCWFHHELPEHGRSVEHSIYIYDSGWPFRSLRRTDWNHMAITVNSVEQFFEGLPAPTWWNSGAPFPSVLARFNSQPGWKRLPIRPIPLAFAANTAIYAIGLCIPIGVVSLIRRRRRRRLGLCHGCGYDRAGLDAAAACPECGRTPGTAHVGV